MIMKKAPPEAWIKNLSGCHVLVYAGDGGGEPEEFLFESGTASESKALIAMILELLKKRKEAESC